METESARCVVHLDMDCFYAQVEVLRLGLDELQPLGVRQKGLMVTCNYAAREAGLRKCMPAEEARRTLPGLVLVCGEDLAPYRRASTAIVQLLRDNYPGIPLQRLGLDEFILDVTSLLTASTSTSVTGSNLELPSCGCGPDTHRTHEAAVDIAAQMRLLIKTRLRMTCCAGIAHNKLLAKLSCSLRKPDSQTVTFPCRAFSLMSSFKSAACITGIGQKTAEMLAKLKIESVSDLQNADASSLKKMFGSEFAAKLKNLSYGIDPSPVKTDKAPLIVGVEDSYKNLSSPFEVRKRFETLFDRLSSLILDDGRRPGGIRITVQADGEPNRRSRQCNISPSMFDVSDGRPRPIPEAGADAVSLCMETFYKMIPERTDFKIVILGLAFVKLQELHVGKQSIKTYFSENLPAIAGGPQKRCSPFSCEPLRKKNCTYSNGDMTDKVPIGTISKENIINTKNLTEPCSRETANVHFINASDGLELPAGIDRAAFCELPDDLQKELLDSWRSNKSFRQIKKSSNRPIRNDITKYFINHR